MPNFGCNRISLLEYTICWLFDAQNATSHLKKVFWPNIFVGTRFQILNIQAYASGLKPESAAILNQNPFFEMACSLAFGNFFIFV